MELSSVGGRRQEPLLLERRSLLALASDSRTDWRHEIPRRKADPWDGRLIPRSRRVSLTFRTVVIRFYRASGPWGFLSNLYPCEVRFEERTFKSAEHAYQFGKPRDRAVAEWMMVAPSASLCAQAAHGLLPRQVRKDWSAVKVPRMRAVLLAKFGQNAELANRLRATGEAHLIEESTTDALWGVGRKGTGKNMLGTLLMETRAALRTRIE
jgi:N-glycosidase YbiA